MVIQVKKLLRLLLLLLALTSEGRAQEPEAAPVDDAPLRLSALVSSGTRFYAGFVESKTGQAFLVPEGGKVLNWRVVKIDETALSAHLVDGVGTPLVLVLKGDAQAAALTQTEGAAPGIKTLEEFLAEHPELSQSVTDVPPMPFPVDTNTVVTYEDFLSAHPEMAGLSNYVAPDLRNPAGGPVPVLNEAMAVSQPVSREEGLRRMAEQAGQPVPENGVTTYEDFLRLHAPSGGVNQAP